MNLVDTNVLNHKLSLSEIAARIAAGEQITIRGNDHTVTRCCPACCKPILYYPHNTYWHDTKIDLLEKMKASGEQELEKFYVYTDGDTVFIQEVYDSFHDGTFKYLELDAQMMVGRCPACGEDFSQVELYCFDHIPRPEEGAQGDPMNCCCSDYRYDHLVRSIEGHALCLVYLGTDPIGIMSYGKNILFRADAFCGYPTEDFQTDCCVFALDCLLTNSVLDASPIGVCCGHYDMNDTQNDWAAAAVISRALYAAGKKFMEEINAL